MYACVRAYRTLFFVLTLVFVTEIFALKKETDGARFEVLIAALLTSHLVWGVNPC